MSPIALQINSFFIQEASMSIFLEYIIISKLNWKMTNFSCSPSNKYWGPRTDTKSTAVFSTFQMTKHLLMQLGKMKSFWPWEWLANQIQFLFSFFHICPILLHWVQGLSAPHHLKYCIRHIEVTCEEFMLLFTSFTHYVREHGDLHGAMSPRPPTTSRRLPIFGS